MGDTYLAGGTRSFGYGTASPASSDWYMIKTDSEGGLAQIDSSANSITLYRGATDAILELRTSTHLENNLKPTTNFFFFSKKTRPIITVKNSYVQTKIGESKH